LSGDAGVGTSLGHQVQHLALARSQSVQWVTGAAQQQLGDDLGVQDGAARRDPAQGVDELLDVGDALLEQMADASMTATAASRASAAQASAATS
jgi:hypothetical protein